MTQKFSRRGMITGLQAAVARDIKPVRIGFVGVGNRGTHHLDNCLDMDSVEIKAICDVKDDYLYRAKRLIQEAKRPTPALYGRGPTDYLRMCERDDLDLIITATPWQWHTPVCVAAMKAGKHAATEVPAAYTIEDCWQLVETSEKTSKHCVMLEQTVYGREFLATLHMAQQGLFGELSHAAGGYVHDLRTVKYNPEQEPWRLQFDIDHNGNLYPTHPMGMIGWWLDINRGDRIEYLTSMSSRATMLNRYAAQWYGDRSPYASQKMAQGDVNITLLRTAQGKTINLYYDTNTPHPHDRDMRLEGSKGVYSSNLMKAYIEGNSPGKDEWEDFGRFQKEYEHPAYAAIAPKKVKATRGHGGGASDVIVLSRLFQAIQHGVAPDMNVYDAATWSVIFPLSEQSVKANGGAVDFPDFTRGKWEKTGPVKLV